MPLPSALAAGRRGLVAVGGTLTAARLLEAYQGGIFPWYEEGQPVLWHSPDPRMVLRPRALCVNRSLRKVLRRGRFTVRMDTAFEAVIRACARVPREGQDGTWITAEMIDAYCELHTMGHAHSVEAWEGEDLVGGLYGVSVGAIFCGESMFARESDASKVAFVYLVRQLEDWGFQLIDCQVYTEHLERFGAEEVRRTSFLDALTLFRDREARIGAWELDVTADGVLR